MIQTFAIDVNQTDALFRIVGADVERRLSRDAFEGSIDRRRQPKLALASRMAEVLYAHFDLDARIAQAGGDPHATPMVVCNRFAGWDHVANFLVEDAAATLDRVGPYVATAWFPAATQGHLTIARGNVGEAVTIAARDRELIAATVDSLFCRDAQGRRTGVVLLGAFEALPTGLGGRLFEDDAPDAFGCWSIVTAAAEPADILDVIDCHGRFYERFFV